MQKKKKGGKFFKPNNETKRNDTRKIDIKKIKAKLTRETQNEKITINKESSQKTEKNQKRSKLRINNAIIRNGTKKIDRKRLLEKITGKHT